MADRNQQSGSKRQRRDWRDEDYTRRSNYGSRDDQDEGRYSGGSEDRDYGYGSYTGNDEGDSSVRAGNYDQGRTRYGSFRDTGGQSGSTGRYAGYGDFGQGDYSGGRGGYSGQGNYGQSGYGQGGYGPSGQGGSGQGGYGQGGYGQGGSQGSSGASRYGRSESGESGYGGSRGGRYSQGTFGTERGGWNEPYGEGQQYTSRGEYGGSSSEYGYSRGIGGMGGGMDAGGMGGGMGQHRGKGPKGYQRSDERIKELLCERLSEDPEIDPSEVTISVTGGKITLEGTVDSRKTKNAIEDIADQCGVQDVQNNLRVQRQGQTGTESSGRSGSTTGKGNDESGSTKTKQH